MLQELKQVVRGIGESLQSKGYPYTLNDTENHRITLSINEQMKDAGLSTGSSVVDLFYEDTTKTVFIGMFRIPKELRGGKLSNELIGRFRELADVHHYTLMVDSCEGCCPFWQKQQFQLVHHDAFGFDIMIYAKEKEKEQLLTKWKNFKKTDVFHDNLYYHN